MDMGVERKIFACVWILGGDVWLADGPQSSSTTGILSRRFLA